MTAKRILSCVAVLVPVLSLAAVAMSQDGRPSAEDIAKRLQERGITVTPEQVERGRAIMEGLRDGVQPSPEQMQKIVGDLTKLVQGRMKETLGATDEEWQVLEPKLTKVQNLMLQDGGARPMLSRLGLGGNGGEGKEPSELQKKSQAVQDLLKNKDAAASDIKSALQDYRDARAKARTELAQAQKELKDVLSLRQEAILVRLGVLE